MCWRKFAPEIRIYLPRNTMRGLLKISIRVFYPFHFINTYSPFSYKVMTAFWKFTALWQNHTWVRVLWEKWCLGTIPEVCLWKWVSEGLQFMSYCEVVEGGLSESDRKFWHQMYVGKASCLHTWWTKIAGRCFRCKHVHVLYIPPWLCLLYAVSCMHLVFLTDGIAHVQMWNFSYVQIVLKCTNNMGTNQCFQNKHCSRTDCTD